MSSTSGCQCCASTADESVEMMPRLKSSAWAATQANAAAPAINERRNFIGLIQWAEEELTVGKTATLCFRQSAQDRVQMRNAAAWTHPRPPHRLGVAQRRYRYLRAARA